MEYRAKPGFSAAFLAPDQPFLRLGMSAIITSIIAITTMTAMTAPIIEFPVSGEVSAALVTAGASEPARGSISPEPRAADVSANAPSASESIAADAAKIIAYLVFLSIFSICLSRRSRVGFFHSYFTLEGAGLTAHYTKKLVIYAFLLTFRRYEDIIILNTYDFRKE